MKTHAILGLFLLSLTINLSFTSKVYANEWLSGWTRRIKGIMVGSSGDGVLNYSFGIIVVHFGSGSNSYNSTIGEESHIYCSGNCRNDFGDIRFTAGDGIALLDYYMYDKVDNASAKFWFKMDIGQNETKNFYIYWGNPDATSVSMTESDFFTVKGWQDTPLSGWYITNGWSVFFSFSMTEYQGPSYDTISVRITVKGLDSSWDIKIYSGDGSGSSFHRRHESGRLQGILTQTFRSFSSQLIVDANDFFNNIYAYITSGVINNRASTGYFKNANPAICSSIAYTDDSTSSISPNWQVALRKHVSPEPTFNGWSPPVSPTCTNVGTTTTIANAPCTFHAKWTGDTGKNISGFIFGTNNTGLWSNETWFNLGSDANVEWSNATKTLNSTISIIVQWQIWANDTDNTWGTTGIQSFTVTFPSIVPPQRRPSEPHQKPPPERPTPPLISPENAVVIFLIVMLAVAVLRKRH